MTQLVNLLMQVHVPDVQCLSVLPVCTPLKEGTKEHHDSGVMDPHGRDVLTRLTRTTLVYVNLTLEAGGWEFLPCSWDFWEHFGTVTPG